MTESKSMLVSGTRCSEGKKKIKFTQIVKPEAGVELFCPICTIRGNTKIIMEIFRDLSWIQTQNRPTGLYLFVKTKST